MAVGSGERGTLEGPAHENPENGALTTEDNEVRKRCDPHGSDHGHKNDFVVPAVTKANFTDKTRHTPDEPHVMGTSNRDTVVETKCKGHVKEKTCVDRVEFKSNDDSCCSGTNCTPLLEKGCDSTPNGTDETSGHKSTADIKRKNIHVESRSHAHDEKKSANGYRTLTDINNYVSDVPWHVPNDA